MKVMDKKAMDGWFVKQREREAVCAKTIKGKALLVIDHLLSLDEADDPLLNKIYRIAHSAAGVCENKHEGWKQEIEETYKQIQERNR